MNEIVDFCRELFEKPGIKYGSIVILILLSAFILSRILRIILRRSITIAAKKLQIEPRQYNFIHYAVNLMILLAALILIFYTIPELRSLGITLFASAGFLTAILLFASQQARSNIISGVFIIASKPFRVNDIIKVGSQSLGKVEDIILRYTVIRDFEIRRIIIPNSVINAKVIINSSITDEKICNFVDFGISYDSDIDKAMEIITREAKRHPNFLDHRTDEEISQGIPEIRVGVIGFGDSSVNLRAYVWTADHSTGFALKMDLYKSVKETFDREGIEIPFPYRTLVFKNKPDKQQTE